ncbi:MAG: radical SAM protein [Patescibacteria group bacterium]|nr:radical SAM protein [Patescibacteria group bacterium]
MLVDSSREDTEFLNSVRRVYVDVRYVNTLFLLLTDRCNFDCSYCFIRNTMKGSYKFSEMNLETIKMSIELFLKTVSRNDRDKFLDKKPYSIFFFGGEPLLNHLVFQESLDYIEKIKSNFPKEIQLNLITNGSVMNDSLIESIKKHNIQVGISLDGRRDVHDLYRKDRRGKGTFDKVLKTIKTLRQAQINVGISCTILEHNVDSMVEFSKWLNDEFGIYSIGFNSLIDTDAMTSDVALVKRYSNNIASHFRLTKDCGIQNDTFLKRYKTFLSQRMLPYNCAAPGRQIVVSPSGKVGLCHEGTGMNNFFFGDVHDQKFDYWASPTVKEWQKRSPLTIKACERCLALGLCGGGCPYTSFIKYGTIWKTDHHFCIFARKMVRAILEEAIAQI